MAETTKKNFLIAFNNHLKEFLHKLTILLPDNTKLTLAHNMYHAGLKINPTLYINNFHELAVTQFEEDILMRKEAVFIEHDFSFIPGINNGDTTEFKDIWKGLTDKYKNVVWDYLKVLVVLSKRYHA